MPPRKKTTDLPKTLRPYAFHGIEFTDWETEDNPRGECPWCGKEKFSVSKEKGFARCLVCNVSHEGSNGLNPTTFIRELYELYKENKAPWEELSDSRKISVTTLKRFGLVWNGDSWIVPAFNAKKILCQLYRYGKTCFPTPTLGAQMFGLNTTKKAHKVLNVFEGPWDMMAFDQELKTRKLKESVVGLPGISTMKDVWMPFFRTYKRVNIFQDNDHPNVVDGQERGLGGMRGVAHIANILSAATKTEVRYLQWGENGYNTDIENKTDVRDVLTGSVELGG